MILESRVLEGRAAPVTVADVMQRDVLSVSPSTSIRELAALLLRHGVSGVPVVDPEGAVVGTVSTSDLSWLADLFFGEEADSDARARAARQLSERTVRSIMTPDVFGVGPADTLVDLAKFFSRTGLGRAVVLEDGRLVGVVSVTDLLHLIVEEGG